MSEQKQIEPVTNSKLPIQQRAKTILIKNSSDIDKVPWNIVKDLPPDDTLVVASYNPNNCRFELDFYKVSKDDYRNISSTAHTSNKEINYMLQRNDSALHLLSIFFAPLETTGQKHDLAYLKTIMPYYPGKYEPLLCTVMDHLSKDVRIISNNKDIINMLIYYGWLNTLERETKFVIC